MHITFLPCWLDSRVIFSFVIIFFRLVRCAIIVGTVGASCIIEVHVFLNVRLTIRKRTVRCTINLFLFHGGEECFHHTVVIGIFCTGEGLSYPMLQQQLTKGIGSVLTASVRMEDKMIAGLPSFQRCFESCSHKLCAGLCRYFVCDYFSGKQVENGA